MIRFEFEAEMIEGREVSAEITGSVFTRIAEIVGSDPDYDYRAVEHWYQPDCEGEMEWGVRLWREYGSGAPPTFHLIASNGAVLESGWARSVPQRGER
jgi:hypothetical protein